MTPPIAGSTMRSSSIRPSQGHKADDMVMYGKLY